MADNYTLSGAEAYKLWNRYEQACIAAQKSGDTNAQQTLSHAKDKFILHCKIPVKDATMIENALAEIEKNGK